MSPDRDDRSLYTPTSRAKLREELQRDVGRYLAEGNEIERVPIIVRDRPTWRGEFGKRHDARRVRFRRFHRGEEDER